MSLISKRLTLTAALLLPLSAFPASGQESGEIEDILTGAIDPFNIANERGRFIQAAGIDNQLDQAEFAANAKAERPFIRVFDQWQNLAAFDRTGEGTIDWAEASNYRRALRKAVFNTFDKDNNRSLSPEERAEANKALAAGRVPKLDVPTRPQVTPGAIPREGGMNPRQLSREQRLARYDTDGDGRISEVEGMAMGEDQRRRMQQRMLEQYDTDGDGKLSALERAAIDNIGQRMAIRFHDLLLPHADLDGNGQIDPHEQQSLYESGKKLESIGEKWRMDVTDLNGDGNITSEEEQLVQQRFQAAGIQMLPKLIAWNDANGDGMVDEQERMAAMEKVADAAEKQIDLWTQKFDADGNGRLNEVERNELIGGFQTFVEEMYNQQDVDGDGQLNVNETVKFLESVAGQFGMGDQQSIQ